MWVRLGGPAQEGEGMSVRPSLVRSWRPCVPGAQSDELPLDGGRASARRSVPQVAAAPCTPGGRAGPSGGLSWSGATCPCQTPGGRGTQAADLAPVCITPGIRGS